MGRAGRKIKGILKGPCRPKRCFLTTAALVLSWWSLYQDLPRAFFPGGTNHSELFCCPRGVESLSHVLDPDPFNPPPAVVHFHCEALARYISCVCQPEVGQLFPGVEVSIFFAQNEDIAGWESSRLVGGAQNYFRFQGAPTF